MWTCPIPKCTSTSSGQVSVTCYIVHLCDKKQITLRCHSNYMAGQHDYTHGQNCLERNQRIHDRSPGTWTHMSPRELLFDASLALGVAENTFCNTHRGHPCLSGNYRRFLGRRQRLQASWKRQNKYQCPAACARTSFSVKILILNLQCVSYSVCHEQSFFLCYLSLLLQFVNKLMKHVFFLLTRLDRCLCSKP